MRQTPLLHPPHFLSLEGGRETHKQKLYVYILPGRILWHCLLAVGARSTLISVLLAGFLALVLGLGLVRYELIVWVKSDTSVQSKIS